MDKITFCIPTKSNLSFLKLSIASIRENSFRKDHDIIIFVDSDEDGTVEWLQQNQDKFQYKYFINPELNKSLYGIGKAYDFCINEANTEVFMVFHADMVLGKHADRNAYASLKKGSVVCSTRIEPPLFPNNGEKILQDFGMWPEDFDLKSFNDYVSQNSGNYKSTDGIFAPWMMFKSDFDMVGGHDYIFNSCREDSDLFNTLTLAGFTFKQKWNSLVYHFAGRGAGSFNQDEERHKAWQVEMKKSTREFIRKWGSDVAHTPLMKPVVWPLYSTHLTLKNDTLELLYELEPYFTNITSDHQDAYITQEQNNTSFNLSSKFASNEDNDIFIYADCNKLNKSSIGILRNLNRIIYEQKPKGELYVENIKIKIEDGIHKPTDRKNFNLHNSISKMWSGG